MIRSAHDVDRDTTVVITDQEAGPDRAARPTARRAYARPRLVSIVRGTDLLDVLGPAQAGYGNGGFP